MAPFFTSKFALAVNNPLELQASYNIPVIVVDSVALIASTPPAISERISAPAFPSPVSLSPLLGTRVGLVADAVSLSKAAPAASEL